MRSVKYRYIKADIAKLVNRKQKLQSILQHLSKLNHKDITLLKELQKVKKQLKIKQQQLVQELDK